MNLLRLKRAITKGFKKPLQALFFHGNAAQCNLCGRTARTFKAPGPHFQAQSTCPWCGSLERHQLAVELIRTRTDLFSAGGSPKDMLHFAPETGLERLFRERLGERYTSADLFHEHADRQIDLCAMDIPDDSVGLLFCFHVLEHVPDDRAAIREMRRVVRPGGVAMVDVPIVREETYEDPSIVTKAERLKHFGQDDHVRTYGPDFYNRLRDAGFEIETPTEADAFDPMQRERIEDPR